MRHIKFMLKLLLYNYLMIFPEVLFDGYMYLGKDTIFLTNYIYEVNTPTYTNDYTRYVLDSFNTIGDNEIIKYYPRNKIFNRKVIIKEVDKFKWKGVVGLTTPFINTCEIEMLKGLDNDTYSQVLLHELMHCYGYTHTYLSTDLMYPYVDFINPISILYYAKDIELNIAFFKFFLTEY